MRLPFLPPLLFAAALAAQQPVQPANDVSPTAGGGGIVLPLHGPDCFAVRPFLDVTATSGLADVRILGIANVEVTTSATTIRKWFFSGSNGGVAGNRKIYIYDADRANNPVVSTVRNINQHPLSVSPFWGHRDGEGYTYVDTGTQTVRSVAIFGDENRNLQVLDALAETWGASINLPTYSSTVVRALGVRKQLAVATEKIFVYVSDFSNLIEEWDVDLAANTATRTSNPGIANPGSNYGCTCFEYNGKSYLATFGQVTNTCTTFPTGLCRITVIDLTPGSYGTVVWARTGDVNIVGASPNIHGGIAGGIQHAILNGQPVFAVLHQSNSDSAGFVPYGGYGENGNPDCGSEILVVNGAPTSGAVSGAALLGAPTTGICALGFGPQPLAALPFPLNPACILDSFPLLAVVAFPPPNANGETSISFGIPTTFTGHVVFDAVCFTGSWTSSNPVTVHVNVAPF
jgi:hypothetical protein